MSVKEKFRGTGIAIVTPFNADGMIDWDSFRNLINFWINGKVEYLVVLGTTGESPTIHGEEKQRFFPLLRKLRLAVYHWWQALAEMIQARCFMILEILI
jgi:4-hydroxy-tetrahydrodipicolinate synthase